MKSIDTGSNVIVKDKMYKMKGAEWLLSGYGVIETLKPTEGCP